MEKEARGAKNTIDPYSFKLLVSCSSGLSPSQVVWTSNLHSSWRWNVNVPCSSVICQIIVHAFLVCLKVSVVYTEAYDRIPHPDINLENTITEVCRIRAFHLTCIVVASAFTKRNCWWLVAVWVFILSVAHQDL